MQRRSLFLVFLLIHMTGLSLNELYEKAQNLYKLGVDNNYIYGKIITDKEFRQEFQKERLELLEDNEDIELSLSQCVFMTNGAYGEHITIDISLNMAKNLAWYINFFEASVIGITTQSVLEADGIFSSECAIALMLKGEVLVMQAQAMD